MPFINTKVSVPLSREKEEQLKTRLGEAISIFPGKTERWLMLDFSDDRRLWFAGSNDRPAAMVEVELLGSADRETCARMTARVCEIFSDVLGIPADRVYVNYTFSTEWGWNNANF